MEESNPRYFDWQCCCEIMSGYPLGFEDRPNGKKMMFRKVQRYFKKLTESTHWTKPSNEEICAWVDEILENRKSNRGLIDVSLH